LSAILSDEVSDDGQLDHEEAVQDNQFVTFSVAGEMFAVPMGPVQEIIRVPDVARMPLAPPMLKGLANLRGRVLPIISLRRMFGCEEREHDDATRALVINLGQPLGFVVDRVASVISVEPGQMESTDSIQSIVDTNYLTGVIQREGADGLRELLLTLNFEQLVKAQFTAMGGRSANERLEAMAAHGDAAAQLDEDLVDSDEIRLVSFSVDEQEYAIDISAVQEIVQMPPSVTAVPNSPSHVLGLISLRQRLLPLVSLRAMFGLADVGYCEQHRIVVVALPNGHQVGLVTDAVKEVLSVPLSQAEAMPGILAADHHMDEFSRICRLDGGKRLVSIIATDRLLGMSEIRQAIEVGVNATDRSEQDEEQTMRAETEEQGLDDDDIQVVIFRLGAEEFGVPIMSVQEIVRVPDVLTKVPKTPSFVEGVINLRGTVLPVVDQRRRLGLEAIERNEGQRIMVYTLSGMRTGFIVDSVAEVLRIPKAQITRAPRLSDEQSQLISRVAKLEEDKRLVMLIEPHHLLAGQEMSQMGDMVHEQDSAGATMSLAKAA
jgi:purine-binding chemotaxis protein CheW